MKTNALAIATAEHDPELEQFIQEKDAGLKELARKNAHHFAGRNLPGKEDTDLAPYTGDLKSGYEALGAKMLSHLQPHTHFPEAKMDADFLREKDKQLDIEIRKQEDQIKTHEYILGDFNPKVLKDRLRLMGIITIIIAIGEILFNTKAFQVTGENLLFAFILSISISVAVFVFSHLASFLVKAAQTKWKRRLIIASSLILVTGLFTALAIFRSRYLATHQIQINPLYFVVINLFFFIVSALLSFYLLPPWSEIKQNYAKLKLSDAIQKCKNAISLLKAEKERIKEVVLENTKYRVRISYYANYCAERIRKMYRESLDLFKSTNLVYRTDRCVPECFSHAVLDPEIESHSLIPLNTTDK